MRIKLFLTFFKIIPLIADDLDDGFLSLKEILEFIEKIASSLLSNVYIKITISGEKREITIPELIDGIEKVISEFIDIDRTGIEVNNGALKFILKTKNSFSGKEHSKE